MNAGVRWLPLVVLLFPLVSTAVQLASPDEDRRAKQAVPPQGQALLYVYRTDGGARVSPTVSLNGRELGALAPRTYYMAPVAPGRLDLRAGDGPVLSIRSQEGRVYFVQMSVSGAGDGQLAQVSYGRGRQDVHAARLAREGKPATQTARREPARDEGPEPFRPARAGFNLILKGGSFNLASGSQTILATDIEFSTGSTGLGLEGEWITSTGWAFGAEYLGHSHSYTSIAGNGDLNATAIMINFKKYFRYGATVQPYVGAGVGSAVADLTGSITGAAGGFAVQAMGGLAFRWQHVGIYTELKYRNATTEDASGEGVDLSGMGMFAGLSVQF